MGKRRSEGSVYPRRNKAGGIIGYVADVAWPDGRNIRRLCQTEAEAHEARVALLAARTAELDSSAMMLTVHDLCKIYMAEWRVKGGRKPAVNSYAAKLRFVESYILPAIGTRKLADLTRGDVQRVLRAGAANGTSVARDVYAALASILRWAYQHNYTRDISYIERVPRPHHEARVSRIFTADEIARIREYGETEPDGALWLLLLDYGPRISEAMGLILASDLSPDRKWLSIQRQVIRSPDTIFLSPQLKTKNSYRKLPMTPYMLFHLDRQREWVAHLKRHASAWQDTGVLFPRANGAVHHESAAWKWWERVRNRLDIAKPCGPHTFRHTAASEMIRLGVPITEVAAITGDTVSTLSARYLHAQQEHVYERVQALQDGRKTG